MTDAFNTQDSFSTASGNKQFASLKKLEAALGVEFLERVDESKISLLDQVQDL